MAHNKISDFRTLVKRIGLPLSSHFHVELHGASKAVNMLCEQTELPSIGVMTSELRTTGEIIELPHNVIYDQLQLTFIEDNNFSVKKYMEDWMNKVYNRETRTVGYHDVYKRDVKIFVSDRAGNTKYCVTLYDAYPKIIGQSALSYSDINLIRVPVTLQYRRWSRVDVNGKGEQVFLNSRGSGFNDPRLINGITSESLGNYTGVAREVTLNGTPDFLFSSNAAKNFTEYGQSISGIFQRNGNAAAALLGTSGIGIDSNPNFGSDTATGVQNIGTNMGYFGNSMINLGKNLASVGAVAGNISQSIGGVANSISSLNSIFGAVGINTGLGKIATDMSNIAGSVSILGQMKGMPGLLGSFGANMGATAGELNRAKESINKLPGATNQISNTFGNFADGFSTQGSILQQITGTL